MHVTKTYPAFHVAHISEYYKAQLEERRASSDYSTGNGLLLRMRDEMEVKSRPLNIRENVWRMRRRR